MPFIRIKTGPNRGKLIEVKDQVITVGRDEIQTIQVLDQGVSRFHAEVFRIGENCFVRDLNSTNGTFINGVKVTEEVLKPGDELLIGTTILLFEMQPTSSDHGLEMAEGDLREGTTTLRLQGAKSEAVEAGREVTSRHLSVLSKVGKVLGSGRELRTMLKEAVEALAAALEADHAYLLMSDHATGKLVPRVSIERGESGTDKKVSRTIIKHLMQGGAPILTSDAALDQRFTLSESVVLRKIKSVLAAPIPIRDKVEGLLYLHASRAGFSFKVEDLEMAATAALQFSMAIASHRYGEKVRRGMISTIRALVTAMEIADPRNQGHSERVADYSVALASELGLPREDLYWIRLGGLLHDVGKLAMHHSSQGISRDELEEQHVYAGEKILAGIEGCQEILPAIRYHHERADGTGFPYHLKNDKIPIMARLIIVANHFDNLCTSGGRGGHGMAAKEAVEEIAGRDKEFDDEVVRALQHCHQNGTLYSGASLIEE